jgi:hemolysin III
MLRIYVLIAGTYSPYTIILMDSTLGWTVFGLTWSFALLGIILKLFFTGRFDKLSTALYLLMGWQVGICDQIPHGTFVN